MYDSRLFTSVHAHFDQSRFQCPGEGALLFGREMVNIWPRCDTMRTHGHFFCAREAEEGSKQRTLL